MVYASTQPQYLDKKVYNKMRVGGGSKVFTKVPHYEGKKWVLPQTFPSSLAACRHSLRGQGFGFTSAAFYQPNDEPIPFPPTPPFLPVKLLHRLFSGARQASLWIIIYFFCHRLRHIDGDKLKPKDRNRITERKGAWIIGWNILPDQ